MGDPTKETDAEGEKIEIRERTEMGSKVMGQLFHTGIMFLAFSEHGGR